MYDGCERTALDLARKLQQSAGVLEHTRSQSWIPSACWRSIPQYPLAARFTPIPPSLGLPVEFINTTALLDEIPSCLVGCGRDVLEGKTLALVVVMVRLETGLPNREHLCLSWEMPSVREKQGWTDLGDAFPALGG
jgi:hypothetical protein